MFDRRLLIALVLSPLLAGASCQRKDDLPPVDGPPEHTVTTTVHYVTVNRELTRRCPIAAAGTPSEAPRVAAERRASLEKCNAQLEAIEKIQGTKVEE